MTDRPTKRCPDCAEMVLAAARRCRFCGYSFGDAASGSDVSPVDGLLGIVRRRVPELTIAGVLAAMGVTLGDGEQAAGMWLARVDGADGYVIITDQRLIFVASDRPARGPLPTLARLLSELASVEVQRQRLRPVLVINWPGSGSLTLSKLSAKDLPQVHSLLLARL